MSRIIRTEPNALASKAVEYHGFVFTGGVVARDASADIHGQTRDVHAPVAGADPGEAHCRPARL